MFYFSNRSKERMAGVDQRLVDTAMLAITITVIDFGVPETGGKRTEAQQNELYVAGKSRCDGYEQRSNHQDGNALDVYAYVDGQASWDDYHLAMVAAAMLQAASMLGHKITWGGLWSGFPDKPHFQIED